MNVQPVSTPPSTSAASVNVPPARYRYQLSRLIFGNARSFAPIMIGIRKLPSVAGTDGTRNRKIMMMPCIVKNLLYVSDATRSGCGVSSSSRIRPANASADKEEERDRDQVQHRDPLVVSGQQPAQQAVLVVDVVPLWQCCCALVRQRNDRVIRECGRAHGFTISCVVPRWAWWGPQRRTGTSSTSAAPGYSIANS